MDFLSVKSETTNFLTIQGYEGIWKTNNRGKIIISLFLFCFIFSSLLLATFYTSAGIYMYMIFILRIQAKLIFRHTFKQCLTLKVFMTSPMQGTNGKDSFPFAMAFFARSHPIPVQGRMSDKTIIMSWWGQNSHDPRPHKVKRSVSLAGSEIYPCAVSRFNASFGAEEGLGQGIGFTARCTGAELSPWAQLALSESSPTL